MDLSLPGVDGFEATRQLKADLRTRHIPVLALSGHVGADTARRALEAGCDGFLVKPTPVQDVVVELERLVGRAHHARRGAGRLVTRHAPGLVARGIRGRCGTVRVVELERRTGATVRAEADRVAVEEPMEVRVNGAPFAVIMRTPGRRHARWPPGSCWPKTSCATATRSAAIEQCDDVEPEARGNVLNVTVVGEAVERLVVRLGERRQVITTAGVRTVRPPHHRVAALAGGHGRRPLDGAGGGGRRRCRWRCAPAQRTFDATGGVHAAAPVRSRRHACCARRGRRPPQRRRQDHRPARCSTAGCRSIARCSS